VVLILNLPAVVEQFARTRPTQAGTPNSGLLLTHTDRMRLAMTSASGLSGATSGTSAGGQA
jgi:hypothetical protein